MIRTLTTGEAAHLLLRDENAAWSWSGAYALIEYLEDMETKTYIRVCTECGYKQVGYPYTGVCPACDAVLNYEENNTPIEFDRVAIRCDFDEYSSATEAAENYDFKPEPGDDEETTEAAALKYLQDNTQVIQFDGGVIIEVW